MMSLSNGFRIALMLLASCGTPTPLRSGVFLAPGRALRVEDGGVQYTVIIPDRLVTVDDWALAGGSLPESGEYEFGSFVVNVSWFDAVRYANSLSRMSGLEECYALTNEPEGAGDCAGVPLLLDDCGLFDAEQVTFLGLDCDGYRLISESEWRAFLEENPPFGTSGTLAEWTTSLGFGEGGQGMDAYSRVAVLGKAEVRARLVGWAHAAGFYEFPPEYWSTLLHARRPDVGFRVVRSEPLPAR